MLNLKKKPFHITQKEQLNAALLDLEMEAGEIETELFDKNTLRKLLKRKLNESGEFIKLVGGYSNETYLINDLVLRFPKLTNPLVRNQSIEVHNLLIARRLGLSPLELIAYYAKHNLLITRFITNYKLLTQDDFKDPEKIKIVAKLVNKLHYCTGEFKKNPETPIAFVDSTSESFKKINTILNEKDKVILEKITELRTILASFNICERPSHGDLHHGNLIEQSETIQLIDWEVSSVADPAYDIARLFCVSDLDEESRKIFLDSYKQSGKITLNKHEIDSLKQRIQLFEPINYFSIVLWARFELQFSDGDKKKALDKTVFIYHQKTLETLDSLNLDRRFKSMANKLFHPYTLLFFQHLNRNQPIRSPKRLHLKQGVDIVSTYPK